MFKKIAIKTTEDLLTPVIDYDAIETSFGKALLGLSRHMDIPHVCFLHFVESDFSTQACLGQLRKCWSKFDLVKRNLSEHSNLIENINQHVALVLNGTKFQQVVWEALLKIPFGEVRSYTQVAEYIQQPKSVRAVANAIAVNNVAVLIPCHRVVSKSGNPFKYRWGESLKKQLLNFENIAI